MSTYSSVRGEIHYTTRTDLKNALTRLSDNGWEAVPLSKTIQLTEPADTAQIHGYRNPHNSTDDAHDLVLHIPDGYYRNLTYILSELQEKATEYSIISTTTDGGFYGKTVTEKTETKNSLDEWINKYYPKLYNEKPEKSNYTGNNAWFSDYIEWQSDCEETYRTHKSKEIGLSMRKLSDIIPQSVHSNNPK